MRNIIKKNSIFAVSLILIALIFAAAFGIGFYDFFVTTVSAQGPGGGQGMGGGQGSGPENTESAGDQEAVAVEVADLVRDDFYIYSTVSAQSEAMEEVILTPRIQEVVTEVLVEPGDRVESGQTLIKMDARNNEISVIQAEASLKSAKANLQKALNGPRPEEISRLESQLEQAESELNLRKDNYQRQQQLFDEGYLSQSEIDQAHNQLIAAQSSYQAALKNLELTKAGSTEEEIAQLESQVTQAEASLEQAKLQKEYTAINSPINGIIAEINARRGQMLGNESAAIVSNIDQIKLTAYVNEQNINKLVINDQAQVDFTALAEEFTGQIKNISPRAASNRRSFPVEIVVENPDHIIKAGMTAQVSLPISRAENSIIISQNALLEDEEGYYTYVVRDNTAERRNLEIILEDENKAAVSSGLQEEEKVVTLGKESINDGSNLNVINRGDN